MAQASPQKNQNDALQAFLGSLAANSSQSGPMLSAAQVKRLSEKLDELVGAVGSVETRNERGELVNEEGLPIIDITEPLIDADTSTLSEPIPDEPDLIPLTSLPSSERKRRRIERDRILDLLEQEENMQRKRDADVDRDKALEAQQRRKEGAQFEIKAAREMQKRMGKALLRNMAEAREKEERIQKEEILLHNRNIEEQKNSLKQKKNVSFANLPPEGKSESEDHFNGREKKTQLDWGDVAPAKLRSTGRSALVTKAQMNRYPMRLDVVERLSALRSEPEESVIHVGDSDDEHEHSPSPVFADMDEYGVTPSVHEDRPPNVEISDSVSDEDDAIDELVSEDDEFDLDAAQHHREIALAYYAKRNAIGESASKAMMSHSQEKDEWNQPEVPLDATLSSSARPKTSMSRFKADRIASVYNVSSGSASTSLGPSTLPVSGSQTLRRAIRTGRLENDILVGGDAGESGSEPEDENAKEIFELLRRGEVHNAGPTIDSQGRSLVPGPGQSLPSPISASGHKPLENIVRPAKAVATAPVERSGSTSKPRISKFKLSRSSRLRPLALPDSSPNAPVSDVGGSSPILPAKNLDGVEHQSSFTSLPTNLQQSAAVEPPLAQFPSVVDSPSFSQSTIVISPSFPPPRHKPSSDSDATPNPFAVSGRRPDQPPIVMSTAVLESTGNTETKSGEVKKENGKEKKVSRFLAERM